MNSNIQKLFASGTSLIHIPPGEYAGPLTISHSCTVDGHGATLWTKTGAALIVDAPNVTIKNLRVELITQTKEFIAVEVRHKDVRLEDVEVFGNIRGFEGASEDWSLPRTIDLGIFAVNEQNEFSSHLKVAEPCRVLNSVYGLTIEPQSLSVGEIDLRLTVSPMKDGMILYGSFLLETSNKILRRIYVSGRAQNGAAIKTLLQQKPQQKPCSLKQQSLQLKQTDAPGRKFFLVSNLQQKPQQKTHSSKLQPTQPKQSNAINKVKSGQKIPAPTAKKISVAFKASDSSTNMQIDACAFCLGKNKRVQRDSDVIFFNNPCHDSLGVSLDSKGDTSAINLSLQNLPSEVQAVVVCFSIYDEGNRSDNNFSKLFSPKVVVYTNETLVYEFPLKLGRVKIFKALEMYREKSDWTIHFIGSSSEQDFRKLCEFYGVQIF